MRELLDRWQRPYGFLQAVPLQLLFGFLRPTFLSANCGLHGFTGGHMIVIPRLLLRVPLGERSVFGGGFK